uniref:Uncharacterized protein n=1 Tax=Oncorhynchus kisutch TaxID=8019 RepID=A0A8C7GJG0_ONCKI
MSSWPQTKKCFNSLKKWKMREEGSCEVRGSRQLYLEEFELARELWRRQPGERKRVLRRTGDCLRGDRDLKRHRGGCKQKVRRLICQGNDKWSLSSHLRGYVVNCHSFCNQGCTREKYIY